MSGVAALFRRDGRPVAPEQISAMLAVVPHLGVDGVQAFVDGGIGLGHATLRVTPEDLPSQQPCTSPTTDCVIVADGRLDYREELLAALPGRPRPSSSDAELILLAYESWDIGAFQRLDGDFAALIWDPRSQRVIAARDVTGQRQLFYRLTQQELAVGSEIQQLLVDPAVPIEPNEDRIREFLSPHRVFGMNHQLGSTFFAGIESLPPAHVLVVERDRSTLHRYWELPDVGELRYRRDAEYADHYRHLLFDAVKSRLRSVGPVGIMLSGGIDSTSIACAAQELYRSGAVADRGFESFSYVYPDDPQSDERPLIEAVRDKYGFEAHFLEARTALPTLSDVDGFLESPIAIAERGGDRIWAAAAERGVRVVLTGAMADLYLCGSWLVHDSLIRRGRLRQLTRHIRAHRRVSGQSLRYILALSCLAPLLPLPLLRTIMTRIQGQYMTQTAPQLVPNWIPETLRRDLIRRHMSYGEEAMRARRFASPSREEEYRLLFPPALAFTPRGWPVEARHPFIDRRLIEFAFAIPPDLKFDVDSTTDAWYARAKKLMRDGLRGILPEVISGRTTKTLFDTTAVSSFARYWGDYVQMFGPGSRPEIVARGYVDGERFFRRLTAMRERRWPGDANYVEIFLGLEVWLRSVRQPRASHLQVRSDWRPVSRAV